METAKQVTQASLKARLLMWVQFLLAAGILLKTLRGDFHSVLAFQLLGALLFLPGVVLFTQSIVSLGKSLTPDPVPKSNAQLVTSGAYCFVRHPIYSAVVLMSFGWSLFFFSIFCLILSVLLYAVLNWKASYEEYFLSEKFPEYQTYCEKVGRLVPKLGVTK